MGGQVFHLHLRHNEEAAVVDNLAQILAARLLIPADPTLARRQPPSRSTECKTAHVTITIAFEQIAQLRAAQRSGAQVVITIHQLIPEARSFGLRALDDDTFNSS